MKLKPGQVFIWRSVISTTEWVETILKVDKIRKIVVFSSTMPNDESSGKEMPSAHYFGIHDVKWELDSLTTFRNMVNLERQKYEI